MVETSVLTFGFGIVVFLVVIGLYERYEPDNALLIVLLSFLIAMVIQLADSFVINGDGDLVTISVPYWVDEIVVAVSIAFFAVSAYVIWRWAPDSPAALDTEREQQIYRIRWIFYGVGVILGGTLLFFFGWGVLLSIGVL